MSATTETYSTGLPVPIGKIDRELKKLWEQGDERMTRASLVNLAVYSEAPNALEENTQIVAQITTDHACRAIVIAADPSAKEPRVKAWIAAHCHVSRAGSKQICSEQLSFSLAGSFAKLLPNIVFAHLDSDLPFYLWWRGEFPDPIDPHLWSWVDRLIFDSQTWPEFETQMRLLEIAQEDAGQRMVLCDLNWTRLIHWRLALAQMFDCPASHDQLAQVSNVEIDFAPGYRSTALLMVGWLAAQLGWMPQEMADERALSFSDCAGELITVALQEKAGEPINRCSLHCGATEFRVTQKAATETLTAAVHTDGSERKHQFMPAGRNDPVALVSEELLRGGPHRVYLGALQLVRDLL